MPCRIVTTLVVVAASLFAQAPDVDAPPHIVVFMADDLGWNDVGYHGSDIRTPHIDRLAESGLKLEQFYVQPVCSPTRAALMTGRYPIRLGLQYHVIRPWAQYGVDLDERMLPQALKTVGYETALVGKWHLGMHAPEFLPTRRGFDHQYGHYLGMLDYYTKLRNGGVDWNRDDRPLDEEGYATDQIRDESIRLIKQHDASKPLFMFVAFNAPHTPLQVPEKWTAPYADLKPRRRKFAGMVACMDDAMGRIIAALEDKGMRKDTLIFFSSDNGGPAGRNGAGDNHPLRAGKGSLYEGGVRVPAVASWPGRLPQGEASGALLHICDLHATLLAVAGVKQAAPKPLDGKNAWHTLADGAPSPRTEVLLNHEKRRSALRIGDWKLVIHRHRGGERVELFDLAEDPSENVNRADRNPGELARLQKRLTEYIGEAAPERNSDKKPEGWTTPTRWGHAAPKERGENGG